MNFFTTGGGKALPKLTESELLESKKKIFTQSQYEDEESNKNMEEEPSVIDKEKDQSLTMSNISPTKPIETQATQLSQDTITIIIKEMDENEKKESKSILKGSKRQSILHQQPIKYPTPLKRKAITPLLESKRRFLVPHKSILKTTSVEVKPIPQSSFDQVSFLSKYLDTFKEDINEEISCPIPSYENALQIPIIDDRKKERKKVTLSLEQWKGIILKYENEKWLKTHLQHVIWKQSGYYFHNRNIEFEVTVNGIKKEIEQRWIFERKPKRSFYRQIYNKDENCGYCHIGVVANIISKELTKEYPLLLMSDGWYTIQIQIDQGINELIKQNKIYIGQKLRICCLEKTEDWNEREPWEGKELIFKTNINCIRRGERNEKLGRTKCKFMLIQIDSVRDGIIPCIRGCVERVYPMKYKFKNEKGVIGEKEYINERNKRMKELEKEFERKKREGASEEELYQFKEEGMKILEFNSIRNIKILDGMKKEERSKRIIVSIWNDGQEDYTKFEEKKWYEFFSFKGKRIGGKISIESTWNCNIKKMNGDIELPKEFEERKVVELLDICEMKEGEEVDIICCILKIEEEYLYISDGSMKMAMIKRNNIEKKQFNEMDVVCIRNIVIESVYNRNIVLKETGFTEITGEGKNEEEKMEMKKLRNILEDFSKQFEGMKKDIVRIIEGKDENEDIKNIILVKELQQKDEKIKELTKELEELKKKYELNIFEQK
ncbi:BRCA2, oligonucleotide/oligosaccharide-binding, domain 1, putative [Entamoeba histolytica HM-1:IMSS-B]|uniref:BRCA2 OB1 domain-containing protein n=6 Tax=Entamoeba histolytica TaxID=5759 RepID=C4M5D0_ENTH1|nr:hypothetical protein EHI_121840 [Entamoeba histolytica HM-1:IMSS]EMD44493.1 BRCA2 oligonucleotide/oligosaccharidebinding 1 domain containing protein [Entamoeba histolytica KU27]EMH72094.1 BRCA2, oligonucleotide/oligosaccharide-binding, domain 1, putative [Entamoeba histolytica HM-1:IMSS-B]EMS14929.1 BRCA2, oligonucleotide/oligosaccharide-binding, domain 1 protein [Entamoeba histolytica HM-3:IMSS]ENY64639.1 BRCA2, oligonucleotide/oligosaccharide-binding, domain 1 protein [Entamoeba histolytic|eukprot:XP_651789.1 hypothetical protein EHI_121840 [Entamoeba histolytica HM-1:IMSS]